MKIWIVTFRYGSRVFARAFSNQKRAELRALRIKRTFGVTADIVPVVLDGPDELLLQGPDDYPRPDGAT